ncbi:MAG: KaiC family ATPase implicated in signal transduction [Candidatus Methanohalarchaeum thermophilum]|uniref:KaiC family ATPase implicated in signal transduction n=1 Tax=Methanohalarchaeum thermophilum TaxID=1903181 RepID=A0A1Q6DXA7_METT1|nr:MAG: KaiC family ATPase implicated in signal transduction [Candidatus Methanohalarchaeum thermophilum]
MSDKIKTGVYGLDPILGGGYREGTVNLVYGKTGVGKTTFGLQYALYGLNRGEKVTYVSFEMTKKQIVKECKDMGWDEITKYLENNQLEIIHEFGEDVLFLSKDLLKKIRGKDKRSRASRVIIDPLTHLTFSLRSKNERKALSKFFEGLRNISTAVITLEERGLSNDEDSSTPLYLADSVVHLENLGFGEMYDRTLKIIKNRGTNHGEGVYPIDILSGLGLVVEASEDQLKDIRSHKRYDEKFVEAKKEVKSKLDGEVQESILNRLEILRNNWTRDEKPDKVIEEVLRTEKEE